MKDSNVEKQRKDEEQRFHDVLRHNAFGQRWSPALEKDIRTNPLWVNMKYYSIERRSRDFVLQWLYRQCVGKEVLDYCCGNGEDAILLAKHGVNKVTGIDISGVSINNCNSYAACEKVSDITSFRVMDAENLEFDDNNFDVVTEYGCLHHLELEKAFSEISRVLKPAGKAICNEALGHNLAIRLYRRFTPKLRTKFEAGHILRKKELVLAKRYFEKVECYFFHLFTLCAVPFRNTPFFKFVLPAMEFIDCLALKIPVLKWQAWQVVFILSGPRKEGRFGDDAK